MAVLDNAEADSVLSMLQSPDNATRSRAEAQLNEWSKNPTFLLTLMTRAHHAETPGSRQLAATLLSWRVPKLWPALGEEDKVKVQATLLECFSACTEMPVLRALGESCNALCQSYALHRNVVWEDLLRLVASMLGSDHPARRRAALEVLASLIDSMGLRLQHFYPQIRTHLPALVRDQDTDVQAAALGVVGTLASCWSGQDEAIQSWQGTADATLEAVAAAISSPTSGAGAQKVVAASLRTLSRLAPAMQSQPLAATSVELACRVLESSRCSEQCQVQALQLLRSLVRRAPTLLAEPVLAAMVPVVCRATKDDTPSVDDLDEVSASALAARDCLRSMTRVLPAQVLPQVFEAAQAASQSKDAMDRAAAVHMVCFALCGASEAPAGWATLLTRALTDATVWVRQAACEGAASLAEALKPSPIVTEGLLLLLGALASVLPVESQPELAHKAAVSTAAIFKELSTDEAAPALQAIVPALLQALQITATAATRSMPQCDAIVVASAAAAQASALGAVASTTSDHFVPFALSTANVLLSLLRNCPSKSLNGAAVMGLTPAVFAACLDAAGATVAAAWTDPSFSSMREELAVAAQQAIVDSAAASEVRASAHNFFAGVALASFEEFAPYLPHVVPPAIEALRTTDGSEAGTTIGAGSTRRAVRTDGQEERVAAVEALGSYATAVGSKFAMHLPNALNAVCPQAEHASPNVRAAVARALERMGRCLGDLAAGLPEGAPDRPAAVAMAQSVVRALCTLIDGRGLDGSAALRSSLQTKEDLAECEGFVSLAGPQAAAALAAAGGGRHSDDVESSDGEDDLDDGED
eukprot:TRINITY_DN54154_c0_g1_i1.p1 TRINITY_DN54154_c0_g1~~TRINITY_DN54154_c0_g1_i1.p1  ORF type:complete len:816 (+),score=148.55 TRINITY_DN54154_c0_g1_i1:79-2526(+)